MFVPHGSLSKALGDPVEVSPAHLLNADGHLPANQNPTHETGLQMGSLAYRQNPVHLQGMASTLDMLPRALLPAVPQNPYSHRDANNGLYHEARAVPDDQLRALLAGQKPLRFDWENKWLRGDQYAHMLNRIDAYCAAFGMAKHAEKQHPENIYTQPESK